MGCPPAATDLLRIPGTPYLLGTSAGVFRHPHFLGLCSPHWMMTSNCTGGTASAGVSLGGGPYSACLTTF